MADPFVQLMQELRFGRHHLVKVIASGGYGRVYLGQDKRTHEYAAIKLEHCKLSEVFYVFREQEIYEEVGCKEGFPELFWADRQGDFACLAMELLGPSLDDLLDYCGGTFSLKITLMLADQLLQRFKCLHDTGHVHRDVKPNNFLMGMGLKGNTVYMTDLGAAGIIKDPRPTADQLEHGATYVNKSKELRLVGTRYFASIQGHFGTGLLERDDLESLGYMLVYMMKGRLPWHELSKGDTEDDHRRVYEMKRTIAAKDLCHGLPEVFVKYFNDLAKVKIYEEVPDVASLRRSFTETMKQHGYSYDNVFDWTVLEYDRLQDEQGKQLTKGREVWLL